LQNRRKTEWHESVVPRTLPRCHPAALPYCIRPFGHPAILQFHRGMLERVTNVLTMEAVSDVARARAASHACPVLVLKHSAWCGISSGALFAFGRHAAAEIEVPHWMVTIQTHAPVSEFITRTLHVAHQSPQLILLRGGEAIWTRSHREISLASLQEALAVWRTGVNGI
jgi:bacillithiol system protein YtxJ